MLTGAFVPRLLPEPHWQVLPGGTADLQWIEDRDRKVALGGLCAATFIELSDVLAQRQALLHPTPDVLIDHPKSIDWYISLAGYSLKALRSLREIPKAAGLKWSLGHLRDLILSRQASPAALLPVAAWLSKEIDSLYPLGLSQREAEFRVALVLGGRIVGQGQNLGGDQAVTLTKRLLFAALARHGCQVLHQDGIYRPATDIAEVEHSPILRVASRVLVDFTAGGDRPDMKVSVDGHVYLVAEIKGRKDLSNQWESWMPQVVDHMTTWQHEYPRAERLLLATVITPEAIEGQSMRGTARVGLRQLYANGALTGVVNLSHAVAGQAEAAGDLERIASLVIRLAS
jgi:hypothetical protein